MYVSYQKYIEIENRPIISIICLKTKIDQFFTISIHY